MPEIFENFFENNLFQYESFPCNCVEDTEHLVPGEPPLKTYKLQSITSKKIKFAYAAKKGLVKIAPNGTIEDSNILGTLISIPDKKSQVLHDFLNKNGFLFPISTDKYESIDANSLILIINRIKSTVELMTAICEIKKDYQKILQLTLDLMLSTPITIKMESMYEPYTTCQHSFISLLEKASSLTFSKERLQEAFDKFTYTVPDTIFSPSYELDITEYNNIIGSYADQTTGADSLFYKSIVQLYCNYMGSEIERKTIDFLFHYQHEVGIIKTFDFCNGITYYAKPNFINFNSIMKVTLLEIAQYVVGEEINANLNGIHPIYNTVNMTPSWKVDSLLSAIYFSIFYLKPDLELYRPCANPRCGKYFLVKTTSTKTRFCSTECCNRVTQDRYRKRRREDKQNEQQ